jgi:hypothetical protein
VRTGPRRAGPDVVGRSRVCRTAVAAFQRTRIATVHFSRAWLWCAACCAACRRCRRR